MAKVAVRRSVQRLVYDSFTGSGALTAHVPDVAPIGSSWAILNGSFADLADGRLSTVPGPTHVAIINAGTANGEVEAVCRASISGLIVRSNADGTNRLVFQLQTAQDTVSLFSYTDLTTQSELTGAPTGSVPQTDGADYRVTVYLRDQLIRFLIDGVYKWDWWTTDYQTNTYHGVGAQSWSNGWDDFTVRPAATWKNLLVFGDSISMQTDAHNAAFTYSAGAKAMWPSRVAGGYNSARTWSHSVAVGGAHIYGGTVGKNFADQLPLASGSLADLIFCMFGANDASTLPNITSEYQACLQDIKTGWPGVPIYCLGVLESSVTEYANAENRATMNGRIQAAAVAEGATFWDCEGWIIPATDTYDGLHPNATGNQKIANEVLERL